MSLLGYLSKSVEIVTGGAVLGAGYFVFRQSVMNICRQVHLNACVRRLKAVSRSVVKRYPVWV